MLQLQFARNVCTRLLIPGIPGKTTQYCVGSQYCVVPLLPRFPIPCACPTRFLGGKRFLRIATEACTPFKRNIFAESAYPGEPGKMTVRKPAWGGATAATLACLKRGRCCPPVSQESEEGSLSLHGYTELDVRGLARPLPRLAAGPPSCPPSSDAGSCNGVHWGHIVAFTAVCTDSTVALALSQT